ncbi:MAG: hypothetical protein ACXVCV_18735 [Polyangia bacterium]
MTTKILVPLLAAVTIFAVGFVLVELHAPITPPEAPSSPAAPAAPPVAAPPPTPAVAAPNPPLAAPSPPPAAPPSDPLDVVVRGRTRRDWHAYYAQRQQQISIEILRYQTIVDRAIAGEEPDPRELGEAHDKIRELNGRLKEDLEALQQIDGSP